MAAGKKLSDEDAEKFLKFSNASDFGSSVNALAIFDMKLSLPNIWLILVTASGS
jgi:hypothetical protein